MRIRTTLTILALACASGGLAHAAISPERAKELGTSLTAIGAEKAGNKDGSIPRVLSVFAAYCVRSRQQENRSTDDWFL